MPELPEVQVVINGLKEKVQNKKIKSIVELRKNTVFKNIKNNTDLGTIKCIKRKGKYIILETSNKIKILVHLRMTGKFVYTEQLGKLTSHARAYFIFSDKSRLILDDIRTFGTIKIYHKEESIPELECLGYDPLIDKEELSNIKVRNILKNRKAPIKNALLNQKIFSGIGNIYANEILYRAGISPLRSANKLTTKQIHCLIEQIFHVLKEAIACQGCSISNYRNIDNKRGKFQDFLKVYKKEICSCGAKISRIKQAGRTTYFCPVCQK